MSEELKSCPFCGSTNIESFYNRFGVDHATCQYCGASAKNWNTRYESDELPETTRKSLVKELCRRPGVESSDVECADGIAKTIVIHRWGEE